MPRRGLKGRQLLLSAVIAAAAFAGSAPRSDAHPHVWATVRSEIVFGPDHKITGIRHAWTFDEFYTAMAVQGLDADGDGVYSKEELEPLAKVNVDSLQEFDYFTFVRLHGEDNFLPLKPPVDYWVEYDNTVLTLHFTLPIETPIDPRPKDVDIDVYDPSFFVAFGFAEKAPVKIAGTPALGLHGRGGSARPRERRSGEGAERSLLQPARPQFELRLAIRADHACEVHLPMTSAFPVARLGAGLSLMLGLAIAGVMMLVLAAAPAAAQTKPPSAFGAPSQQQSPPPAFGGQAAAAPRRHPSGPKAPWAACSSWVAQTQQTMQRQLATAVKNLKSGNAIGAALCSSRG